MPVIEVCVGQAGNQIGGALMQLAGPLHGSIRRPPQLPARQQPGCVFVDSEPKVVTALRTPGSPSYATCITAESVVYDQNGRGNNWAWGYANAAGSRGPLRASTVVGSSGSSARVTLPLSRRAMDALRRQAEALGSIDTLLVLQSLGGGTGSGLGSRLLEMLRDDYPRAALISVAVAPFASGETPLQHYNTALALATAHEVADAVVFFDNDDVLQRARRTSRRRSAATTTASYSTAASNDDIRLTTRDMNNEIAASLAGVLAPTTRRRRPVRRGMNPENDASNFGPDDGRPGWHDIRRDVVAATDPSSFGHHSGDDEESQDEDGVQLDGGRGTTTSRPWRVCAFDGADLVRRLVPSPALKYVDIRCAVPAAATGISLGTGFDTATSWAALADELVDQIPLRVTGCEGGGTTGAHSAGAPAPPVATLAAHLVVRGASVVDCDLAEGIDAQERLQSVGRSMQLPPASRRGARSDVRGHSRFSSAAAGGIDWCGLPSDSTEWSAVGSRLGRSLRFCNTLPVAQRTSSEFSATGFNGGQPLGPADRSISLACNSNWMVPVLSRAAQRATTLLRGGAYVHWYERYGITREHISTAVDNVLDTVDAYRSLRL